MEFLFILSFIAIFIALTLLVMSLFKSFRQLRIPSLITLTVAIVAFFVSSTLVDPDDFQEERIIVRQPSTSGKKDSSTSRSSESPTIEDYQKADMDAWLNEDLEEGSLVYVTGTIFDIIEDEEGTAYAIYLTPDDSEEQTVIAYIEKERYLEELAEDDTLTIYGVALGTTTYETIARREHTAATMLADIYSVNAKADTDQETDGNSDIATESTI
ncbi:hypothetical protein [Streptococcus sp. zg-JUN1979]|uniref:hypothetical protein n=1 Tax=Streptococcus sp. zg-JUN1979 TaxID=3391450 RepID=UPI0039A6A09A